VRTTSAVLVTRFEVPSTIGALDAHMSRCKSACSTSCAPPSASAVDVVKRSVTDVPEDAMSPGGDEPVMAGSSSGADVDAPSKIVSQSPEGAILTRLTVTPIA
jgi:hypothetical protein